MVVCFFPYPTTNKTNTTNKVMAVCLEAGVAMEGAGRKAASSQLCVRPTRL